MHEIQLAVLDLAGTTVKDDGQVPRAFAAGLAAIDVVVTPTQVADVRGASKRQAIREFVPEGPDRDRLAGVAYASFRRSLADLYRSAGVESMPGAEEAFHFLRSHGVRVALNTGFDRDITSLLVDALHWDDSVVDAIVCGDDVARGRPAPDLILRAMERTGVTDAQRVMNVGDTVLDLRAGHNARVRWNVGVLSGAHDRERLTQEPHTHLVASIMELGSRVLGF
jgi:phosphonatase-like hydrolase